MRRPLVQSSAAQLRDLFEANLADPATLAEIKQELSHRTTDAAKQLLVEVAARIEALRTEPEDYHDLLQDDVAISGVAREPAVVVCPDDQKKPLRLVRIRPPGTPGLPAAWQPSLGKEFSLTVGMDADLPSIYVEALNATIDEIKRNGGGHKRYELEKGERLEGSEDGQIYRFPFSGEAELFEEAQIELQVAGRRVKGSIVSIAAGRLVLALQADIGDAVPKATLIIDATALLAALASKIEHVKSGQINLNRTIADCVAGRLSVMPEAEPYHAAPPADLNAGQQFAFTRASQTSITWIWGPPGCGKTKTLGAIVKAAFECGRRILVCSNTNKAVDQVILSICQALGVDHPAMQEGRTIRLGRIADNKLNDYSAYVTLDGIVERQSEKLLSRKSEIERELALADNRAKKYERLIVQLDEFEQSEAEVSQTRDLLTGVAAGVTKSDDDLKRAEQGSAALEVELAKRLASYFNLFRRKEEVIRQDIVRNEMQRAQIAERLTGLRQRYASIEAVLEPAIVALEAKRQSFEGVDRLAAEAIVQKSAEQRTTLVAELREIEAKVQLIRERIVEEARIVGATCTKTYLSVGEFGHFDMAIIDEASMVLLPVAWFVAGLAKERVIICGDFRQIPPIVPSRQQSIVEAIGKDVFAANGIGENDERLVMLTTQYRMHDAICQLVSEPMYAKRLTTAADRRPESDHAPDPFNQPLTIVDTSDLWPFETQNAFFSRFNLMHALLVRNIALHLAALGNLRVNEDFGVCTPYSAQSRIIGNLLRGEGGLDYVHVGTVHSYQGDERRTMLLDIPESHGGAWNLGQFVQGLPPDHVGARLINVAISRAQHRLIVMANLTYLDGKLPSTSLLRSVLFQMQRNGAVVSGKDVLALRPVEHDLKGLADQIPLEPILENLGLFDEAAFERALQSDISNAQASVVIYSGFVTPARVARLGDLFRAKVAQGVRIRCVTRPPQTNGSIPLEQGREALNMLEGIGVIVDCRARIHQKVCLIDNRIVWQGSLNPLSHAGRSDEMMTRLVNEDFALAIAGQMSKRRVSPDKAAFAASDAENPRCPECDSRTTYAEGRFGAYFTCEQECGWRTNERNASGASKATADLVGPKCPKCKSATRLRNGRRGQFYGCARYPQCDGTVDVERAGAT